VSKEINPAVPEPPLFEVSFRPFALGMATTIFALVGVVASLFGPLLVIFSQRFHVSLPEAGVVLSVYFVGSCFGIVTGWLEVKRWAGKFVIAANLLFMAAGSVSAALSHGWLTFVASVLIIGFGYGGLDLSLSTYLARTKSSGRTARFTLAIAGYGAGASIGPILIIALHPNRFPVLFAGIGALAVLLSTLSRGVHAPPFSAESMRRPNIAKAQRRPILVTFIFAFILYVAAEQGTSGWVATQLHRIGYSELVGSLVTAAFWGGMALGRVLASSLPRRLSNEVVILGGLGITVVLCAVATSSSLAPYAYSAEGLVLANVYPMAFIWYTRLCPHDDNGLALVLLLMMAGGIIGPGAESLMVSLIGVHVVPVVIAVLALADLAVFASALRFRPPSVEGVSRASHT